jgi:hypothetical protein
MRSFGLLTVVPAVVATPDWTPLKKYTINLDLEPEDRWTEIVEDHKTEIVAILDILRPLFSGDAQKQLLNAVIVPDEFKRELQGMAKLVNATYEDALMGTMFYELSAVSDDLPEEWKFVGTKACTGIVAQNSNGTVFHARNQDYPPPFAPLQYDGTFMKDGKVLFEGTSFAGIIGIGGTCMSPGGFSVSIDARSTHTPKLAEALELAKSGAHFSAPTITREVCARGGGFESAIEYLASEPMIDPLYFIVAGAEPGQGAVVTRNATAAKGESDVWRLEDGYPKENPFYLVETNYDHWGDVPSSDDRRVDAKCIMEELGADNVNMDTLQQVMSDRGRGKVWPNCKSTRGVFNLATIHSELIIPAESDYRTYTRNPFTVDDEVVV